jgi:ABC-type Mn2+/Zn2+ transport system ATPase subunit
MAPAPGAPLLGGDDLEVGRRQTVLRGVAFAVGAGEAWYVLGGNGSGKSTLLLTLLGLLPPLAGTVLAPCGGDRQRLGFVPQEMQRQPTLPCTVAEFVATAVTEALPRSARAAQVGAALTMLGLAGLDATDLRRLSLGQRRRAQVARALARRPHLLVLDEPTANLDPIAARALAADCERLRLDQGMALVHVCHDLPLAREFATHAALVGQGRVHAGPAAALLQSDTLAAALGAGWA